MLHELFIGGEVPAIHPEKQVPVKWRGGLEEDPTELEVVRLLVAFDLEGEVIEIRFHHSHHLIYVGVCGR
jgi:hypothetical protein